MRRSDNLTDRIVIFDTTLRDGSQMEGISFSLEDKLEMASLIDSLGVDFIEGGMPQSNPTDRMFFESVRDVDRSKMVAFGSTCRPGVDVGEDPWIRALVDCSAGWVCIFGKSWRFHVHNVLKTTEEENVRMIRDSITHLRNAGKSVIFDAEHYFDGYHDDPEFAIRMISTAHDAGAEWITLCDTNGGNLPDDIGRIVTETLERVPCKLGIHCHNDSGLAVSSSLLAVKNGARMVQGTLNGIGERCGNANLCTIIPNLMIKMGYTTGIELQKLTLVSRSVGEVSNLGQDPSMPYVGSRAFSHKGGMHIDAVLKDTDTYEHVRPEDVGNYRSLLISEQSGRSGLINMMRQMRLTTDDELVTKILDKIKGKEFEGYQYEGADASLELLIRRCYDGFKPPFTVSAIHIRMDEFGNEDLESEVSIKVSDESGNFEHTASDGIGPVDAFNNAIRKALIKFFPEVAKVRLIDYKVRVIDSKFATAAQVRVLIRSTDGHEQWTTVGVSTNVVKASMEALIDSMEYIILKESWRGS